MKGPEQVADDIADAVRAAIPDQLAAVAAAVGVSPVDVPPPALISTQERDLLALADWPAIFVIVQRLTSLRRVDGVGSDGTIEYEARYPVRLFIFARGADYEPTDLLRKRYVRALREVVLGGQVSAHVDETTYGESYSDVGLDDRKRTIAGAWVEYVAVVYETLDNPAPTPAPTPDGWDLVVDGSVLPPHPALD